MQKYIFYCLLSASAARKLWDIEFPLQRRNIKIQETVTKGEAPSNVQSLKQAKLYKAHFPNEVGKDNHKTWIESEVR